MKKKVRQPFMFGAYIIEYREKPKGLLRIFREKIDTFEEAQRVREDLLLKGYVNPTIKRIG
jgi:hypothetical protein